VPRRGYVVEEGRVAKADEASSAAPASVAVLGFRPLGADREHQWFCEGVAEDITTTLTRSRRLLVVPHYRPAIRFDDAATSVETARNLGASHALEGSVRLAGDRARIAAHLLEARTGSIVWSERFDRRLVDVFAIQDEIAEAIVRHLEIELLPQEWQAMQLSRTSNIEAYTYYRHGRQLAQNLTRSYFLMAKRMFAKAVELDPDFARAHAGALLCECWLIEWKANTETPDTIIARAEQALELDPTVAEAHAARGFALYRAGRQDQAQQAYDRAIAIDPGCFEAYLFAGFLAWSSGCRVAAQAWFRTAADIHPEDYLATFFLVGMMKQDDPEKERWARLCLARTELAAALRPENPAPLSRGAVALAHLGEGAKALSWIARALALDPDDPATMYNSAAVHALLGQPETAIGLLEAYVRDASMDMLDIIRNDGDLDGIRDHPRYPTLMAGRP
jgi:adenylate cyclase